MRYQIELLDKLGFLWEPPNARTYGHWENFYDELCKYHRDNGHIQVPLGSMMEWWIQLQRYQMHMGKLAEQKKEKLNMLGMLWKPVMNNTCVTNLVGKRSGSSADRNIAIPK